ncbi:unnamed protein product [Rhizoctonia solani]|uniref:Uncharacterized protein n=1 Tax=Rhizoctonia solani TaxID=456999 RepID=A0A8H3HWD3_9AGAM|nr:unnamed protein product [Rhizoctonia solani]
MAGSTPFDVPNANSISVASEADSILRPPALLQESVDEPLLAIPTSSPTLLPVNNEQAPLLRKPQRDASKSWYRRAAPKLLVPFILASALCRGMTLASRVEVLTQVACDERRLKLGVPYSPDPLGDSGTDHDLLFNLGYIPPQPQLPGMHLAGAEKDNSSNLVFSPLSPDTCRADPAVQRDAAKLQALVLILAGPLTALTSGFRGQFGDKHGRKIVISLGIFAMLASDCVFLLAASQSANPTYSFLPASRLLVLSPIVEGLLGDFSSLQVAFNAYISDTTPAGSSRARVFARFYGFMFVGFAVGPTFGSLLPFNPFCWSVALGTASLISVLFLPESLPKERRAMAASDALLTDEVSKPENQAWARRMMGYITGALQATFMPMAILLPRKRENQGENVSGSDWNLTHLAITYSLYLLGFSVISIKFLYAQHAYGWNGKQLSYYISFMGTLRALNLIVVLPCGSLQFRELQLTAEYLLDFIKIYKPKLSECPDSSSIDHASAAASPHGSTAASNTPKIPSRTRSLLAVPGSSNSTLSKSGIHTPVPTESSTSNIRPIKYSTLRFQEQQFDLFVARLSVGIEFCAFFLLCSTTSASGFVVTTALSIFGAGASPALQSLALGILGGDEKDVGRLFGALTTLGSIASMILSPMIFGSLYTLTVATFPKAIFVVVAAVFAVALAFLALVQPTRPLERRDAEDSAPEGGN